jgi:dihydrofolate reductase
MKLTMSESGSLDGVKQGLGGPDENRRGGFERGGWQIPLSDEEVGAFLNDVYARADAFLFGRRTYEIFAGSWPSWADTTVIAEEVAAVSELKAEPGGELQVHGSGALARWLLEHGLVDEINLLTFPVIIGQGTRLFADTGPYVALDLAHTRTTASGVTIQVFRPSGQPEYATSTAKAIWRQR